MRWSVLVIVAWAVGCSGKYPVQGKVQFSDGAPLTAGMVAFTDEKGDSGGYGAIGPDGSFEITYDNPRDGLPKGNYRVSVRPPSPWGLTEQQKKTAPPRFGIALKYLQPETSGIVVSIEGKRTDLLIELGRDDGATRNTARK